jgi:C-terminal processing protease CtpA/Prc
MLKKGDFITKVDTEKTSGMKAEDVHRLLQGPQGSTVKIKYIRPPTDVERMCKLSVKL